MGQVFYELGLLATKDVERCSTSNIIGQYVGHTGPKTQEAFEKALGRVLLIDEAYRLADSSFGKDALAEITNILTLPRYRNKMVIILAGYDDEIDRLMAVNPGLTSRFPQTINFPSLSADRCWELLLKRIKAIQKKLDISLIQNNGDIAQKLCPIFSKLSRLPGWGNGRDVETLSENIVGNVMRSRPPSLVLTEEIVSNEMNALLQERQRRAAAGKHSSSTSPTQGHGTDEPPELVQDLDMVEAPEPTMNIQSRTVNIDARERVEELSDSDEDEDEEDKIREFLRQLGKCPANFAWTKVEDGWRCEGGTHFLTDDNIRQQMSG